MHTLKGGVLSYVLAISMLVATTLSMVILHTYYSRLSTLRLQSSTRTKRNLIEAEKLAIHIGDQLAYDQVYALDLYGLGSDSISILKTKWGLFDHLKLRAYNTHASDTLMIICGMGSTEEGTSALYLVDEGRGLAVSGMAKITGVAYLPQSGVQSAYVGRVGYQNKELIYGERRQSEKNLPELELEEVFDHAEHLQGLQMEVPGSLNQSFHDPLLELSGSRITLYDTLSGHLLVKATDRIILDSLCRTDKLIAYAPVIEFRPGFKGSGQFFATDTILVRSDVELQYPTVLACFQRYRNGGIFLEEKSHVTGWILMDGDETGFRKRLISVAENALFTGKMYSNGMVETYGEIHGHVATRRFLVNAPTAIYENYLFNTSIDGTKLDSLFLALPGWFSDDRLKLLNRLR